MTPVPPNAGIPAFSHAMALHRLEPDGPDVAVFTAELNPHWTIGPKIHGGVMLSLCAKAAQLAVSGAPDVAAAVPLAVSANFLSAPDPGPVRLTATVRKRGRRINLVDVELSQQVGAGTDHRVAVRAAVTLGPPEDQETPLLVTNPVIDQMSPEPPGHVESIGPGHPFAEINHLAAGCDIRPDLSGLWSVPPGTAPQTRIWVRPRNEAPDALFALTCGDISMPVTFAVGRTGWAPTVQLTAYVRGVPADGWLRVICNTVQIGQTWFDEDHLVVDSAGRIVVQTRQLALVPAP
jgi:acyl-coenzyme A thioesterase PaaI-like protein